jgi:hypothetical protein
LPPPSYSSEQIGEWYILTPKDNETPPVN